MKPDMQIKKNIFEMHHNITLHAKDVKTPSSLNLEVANFFDLLHLTHSTTANIMF